jgi:uncharacterized OsmC-like protein
MITSKITYLGDLRTSAKHLRSGDEINTDAPVDNKGKGEAFSPTDLMSTSLGTCMITIIGIAAREHGFNIDGATLEITKVMYSEPRRVGEVHVGIRMPHNQYTDKEKLMIEKITQTCPVARSLHPDLLQKVTISYPSP